jgi:hypothetical protein
LASPSPPRRRDPALIPDAAEDLCSLDEAIAHVTIAARECHSQPGQELCLRVIHHLDARMRASLQRPRVPTSEQMALSMLRSASDALEDAAKALEQGAKWTQDLTFVGGGPKSHALKKAAQAARQAAQGLS